MLTSWRICSDVIHLRSWIMNKVEEVADAIANALRAQIGLVLRSEEALVAANAAISTLQPLYEKRIRTALATWQRLNSERKARGKKWLHGTGDMPDALDMPSGPLPDYLAAAIREE
jgi:hypothetical protein